MANKEGFSSKNTATSSLDDRFNWEYFLEVLSRKKYLILFTMVFSILITMSYVFFSAPIYKAKVGFLPPKKTLLPDFHYNGSTYIPCLPKDPQSYQNRMLRKTRESFYTNFLERLLWFKTQKEVFENGNFFEKFSTPNSNQTPRELLLNLNSKIKITQQVMAISKLFSKPTYLEMVGTKPEAMAEYLDLLHKTAIKKIRAQAIDTLKIDHQEKIDRLEEQLKLSQKFKIIDNNFQYARSNAQQPKWFLSGQKVLKEELRATKLGMEVCIGKNKMQVTKPSSQALNSEPQGLEIADISQLNFEVVTITQPSIPPTTPIKPRKFLIISIGIFMGLFLGIILAFISDAAENLERRNKSAS